MLYKLCQMSSQHMLTFNNENHLNEYFKTQKQILILKVYSETCPPCQKIGPHYENMCKIYPDLDYSETKYHSKLSDHFEIKMVPAFLIFKEGKLEDQIQTSDAGDLEKFILKNAYTLVFDDDDDDF